jgi:succinate dehydrogenase / fumarate reductase membrane anchor subunit
MLRKTTRPVDNFELRSWFFMRVSGALIIVLVSIHLAYVHFIHGVDEINYRFVIERWANPTFLLLDILLLTLALAHGANGMRILIDDYIRPKGLRTLALTALYTVSLFLLVIGGVIMMTVQPK